MRDDELVVDDVPLGPEGHDDRDDCHKCGAYRAASWFNGLCRVCADDEGELDG